MPRRLVLSLLVLALIPAALPAQSSRDTAAAIARLHQLILQHGAEIGPAVWSGFRPDTIPTLYVIPQRAKLLLPWTDALPDGLQPLPGWTNAGWTDTQSVSFPPGRIAFLSVAPGATPGEILGLALHEEFHRFERSVEQEGKRFGGGENSLLTASYPVFDTTNEALFALEGRLLHDAVRASSPDAARRLARSFLDIRAERRARLDTSLVDYEDMSEMNEGLAQYALLRGLTSLGRQAGGPWPAAARREIDRETDLLDSLLALGPRSIRRRFYATGSAIALWLDAHGPPAWKDRLVRENLTLTEALGRALASGRARPLAADSLAALRRVAAAAAAPAVRALRARRQAQADSLRARPGLPLTLDPGSQPGNSFQWCGFDPQNLLQAPGGKLLHMRFLRVCNGPGFAAQFESGVVQDGFGGAIHAVIGDSTALTLSAEGQPAPLPAEGASARLKDVKIASPEFSLEAPRAMLSRTGEELVVVPGR